MYHLWAKRCAWGLSIATWVIWLKSSSLLLTYSLLRAPMCVAVHTPRGFSCILLISSSGSVRRIFIRVLF
ncbi:MAG: hypothetical protein ACR2IH_05075 [Pyrinomonadaceae bacterium]